MGLQSTFNAIKILETIENYGISQQLNCEQISEDQEIKFFTSEREFWYTAFNSENMWGKNIDLFHFVVSNWVARIPGLYWTEQATILRQHSESDIAFKSKEWIKFNPPGKSRKVMGGVGTLLLPPTDEGKLLISVTASCNASTGIPVLLFPEVIDALKIEEGDCVNICGAKWQPMSYEWARKFSSLAKIPRGYLVIDKVKKIKVVQKGCPVIYHPFSIMEYEQDDTLLFDYVYASADTKVENARYKLEDFFEEYRKENGRNGKYLLNPNVIHPLFDSQYSSPSELQHPSEKAKINLIYQRIKNTYFNEININSIINVLPKYYQSSAAIRSLANRVGISPALLSEDSAASMSSQLISRCLEKDIMDTLVDRVVNEYPIITKYQ